MRGVVGSHERGEALDRRIGCDASPWQLRTPQHSRASTGNRAAAGDRRPEDQARGSAGRSRRSDERKFGNQLVTCPCRRRRDRVQHARHLRFEIGPQRIGHQADGQDTGDRDRRKSHDLRGIHVRRHAGRGDAEQRRTESRNSVIRLACRRVSLPPPAISTAVTTSNAPSAPSRTGKSGRSARKSVTIKGMRTRAPTASRPMPRFSDASSAPRSRVAISQAQLANPAT